MERLYRLERIMEIAMEREMELKVEREMELNQQYNYNYYNQNINLNNNSFNLGHNNFNNPIDLVQVKRKRGRPPKEEKKHRTCARCNTSDTTEWRKPNSEFLCNACGIKISKQLSKIRRGEKKRFPISLLINYRDYPVGVATS